MILLIPVAGFLVVSLLVFVLLGSLARLQRDPP